jgi:hypothetical protein
MSHYIAPAKPLCIPVGVVKPRKTGGSKQHIQRKAKICPICCGVGVQFTESMSRYGDEGVKCGTCNGTGKTFTRCDF